MPGREVGLLTETRTVHAKSIRFCVKLTILLHEYLRLRMRIFWMGWAEVMMRTTQPLRFLKRETRHLSLKAIHLQ